MLQSLAPQKVERDGDEVTPTVEHVPTAMGDGPPTPVSVTEEVVVPAQASDQFHLRPPTRSGGRHMQDSSFSLSGK